MVTVVWDQVRCFKSRSEGIYYLWDNQPENPSIPDKALVGLLILQCLLIQARGPISRTLFHQLFVQQMAKPSVPRVLKDFSDRMHAGDIHL